MAVRVVFDDGVADDYPTVVLSKTKFDRRNNMVKIRDLEDNTLSMIPIGRIKFIKKVGVSAPATPVEGGQQ